MTGPERGTGTGSGSGSGPGPGSGSGPGLPGPDARTGVGSGGGTGIAPGGRTGTGPGVRTDAGGSTGGAPAAAPECARLAESLRRLKARTGLSLAGLAAKTAYSRSSWERYLNGKKLPPRQAVEALCRLAGEPLGRTVALWELAELEWSGRAARAEPVGRAAQTAPGSQSPSMGAPVTQPPPSASGRRRRNARLLLGVAACGVLGFAAVAAWPTSQEGASGASGKASSASTAPYSNAFPDPDTEARCRGAECTGRNPETMACLDPGTIGSWRAENGQRVEIRYSKVCGAGWAKISKSRVGDRLSISLVNRPAGRSGSPSGRLASGRAEESTQRAVVRDELDSLDYLSTPMVATDAPSELRLCLESAGGGAKECFGR
ncbi:helix-turn-helix domain-containing protein [Streptomyces sp. NPDC050610]|uniref:helix-turn-helix domain-containing protein n=1 Tax=Streptomyces sp. NPDC050610 TaxID=3157097 RepID=UPI00343A8476